MALLIAFLRPGLLFMLAGAAAALANEVTGREWLHWLALHLVFLGGISQLVLGAGQYFAGACLATDPPPERIVRAQLAAWMPARRSSRSVSLRRSPAYTRPARR